MTDTNDQALIKCLQYTANIWNLIAIAKAKKKPYTEFLYDCPCCDYVVRQAFTQEELKKVNTYNMCSDDTEIISYTLFMNCKKVCPLKSIWPATCILGDNPYTSWRITRQAIYAGQIADEATRLLTELTLEQQNDI